MLMSAGYEAAVAARRADFRALRAEARRVEGLAGSEVSFVLIPAGWVTRIHDQLEDLARDDDGKSRYRDLLAEMPDGAAPDAPYRVNADHYEALEACMREMFVRREDELNMLTAGYTPHEQLDEFLLTEELQILWEFGVVLRSLLP